jgi:hypothetical protein
MTLDIEEQALAEMATRILQESRNFYHAHCEFHEQARKRYRESDRSLPRSKYLSMANKILRTTAREHGVRL